MSIDRCECGHRKSDHKHGSYSACNMCTCNAYRYSYELSGQKHNKKVGF